VFSGKIEIRHISGHSFGGIVIASLSSACSAVSKECATSNLSRPSSSRLTNGQATDAA